MMIHRLGHERYARHAAECADEILARKLAVELAVDQIPTFGFGKQRCNLGFGKFFCRHVAFLQDRLRCRHPLCGASAAPATTLAPVARATECTNDWSGSSLIARGNSTIVGVSPETKIRGVCHCSGNRKAVNALATASGQCSGDRKRSMFWRPQSGRPAKRRRTK